MSNMGYCRFQNTLGDLEDCFEHMADETLSEAEDTARRRLIALCGEIFDCFKAEAAK